VHRLFRPNGHHGGFLVIAHLVKLGGLTMLFGSMFTVQPCLFLMLIDLVFLSFCYPRNFLTRQYSPPQLLRDGRPKEATN
jgi:hypothetical protein